jgi:hypothetical protein
LGRKQVGSKKTRLTSEIIEHSRDVLDIGREADLVVVHFVLLPTLVFHDYD